MSWTLQQPHPPSKLPLKKKVLKVLLCLLSRKRMVLLLLCLLPRKRKVLKVLMLCLLPRKRRRQPLSLQALRRRCLR
jgi:hypothetical protein